MASHGIKDRVAIVGMSCTSFIEHWDKGLDDLVVEATADRPHYTHGQTATVTISIPSGLASAKVGFDGDCSLAALTASASVASLDLTWLWYRTAFASHLTSLTEPL